MSDQPPAPAQPPRYAVTFDLRDVIGAAGILLALGGASAFHWGAGVFVGGLGLFALATKLTRG
ncbi:MAG: hypothetical protein WAP03_25410 [Methylorubrum rhodinum]|uniref:hypothetical protein n=1 Tax=Methylorubrum rhodinum TaxID=29428 RepID=UPI003BB1B787